MDMLGLMIFTCFDILSEHGLFKPNDEIKNIEICVLIVLEFLVKDCVDYEIEWACEIVRKCDEAGFDLDGFVRKQVCFDKKDLRVLRKEYRSKEVPEEKEWKEEVCVLCCDLMVPVLINVCSTKLFVLIIEVGLFMI
jgi:hypothetical protein